jgi:Holliday junction resolvase RusA-like endonuclease
MMFCRIELAGPPRGKGRGRAVSTPLGARVYTDAKTRSYEAQLRFAAQQAMNGAPPTGLPVQLTMSVSFAVPASWSRKKRADALAGALRPTVKPDADNTLKLTDALNGIVFDDDKQVVSATVHKHYAAAPGLLIEVEEVWGELALHGTLAQPRQDRIGRLPNATPASIA